MIERILSGFRETSGLLTQASDVAEAICCAATDPTMPMRIAAGADAEAWMAKAN